MRIAIIGAGRVGTTLGAAWARGGHEVTYGVSSGSSHAGLRTASVGDAVAGAELAVLATPWAAVRDAIEAAGDFAGKPLVDVTNPIGAGFTLAVGHSSSGAETVAALAPHARVVKAFNTTGLENMAAPRYGERRLVMPIAGDDAAAVRVVAGLATELGFEVVALAGLARAREIEPLALLWIKLALQWGHGRDLGFALGHRVATDHVRRTPTAQRQAITIVGTGNIGGALARGWLAAGHEVTLAVRDTNADDVRALVTEGATAVQVAGAAARSQVVALAVPATAVAAIAPALGDLAGKIVIDCTNAIGPGLALQYGHTTSSSEEMAKVLPGARVVRAFNQQGAEVLANPMFGGIAATNFVASDDDDARRVVAALSRDLGLDTIEAGPLSSSRYLEPITILWIAMAKQLATREIGLSVLRR